MTKTYTTREAKDALGLNSTSAILSIVRKLGITPVKIPCEYNPQGFVYQFSQDQIDLMRSRPKRGRPKEKK